jgi:hypothetical protein
LQREWQEAKDEANEAWQIYQVESDRLKLKAIAKETVAAKSAGKFRTLLLLPFNLVF